MSATSSTASSAAASASCDCFCFCVLFAMCVSQDVCQILHERLARGVGGRAGGVGGCLQLELKVGNAGA